MLFISHEVPDSLTLSVRMQHS